MEQFMQPNVRKNQNRKPEVIYIGNMRTGSTYIRNYFIKHPDIHFERRLWYFQCEKDKDIRKQNYIGFWRNTPEDKLLIDAYEGTSLAYSLVANIPKLDLDRLQDAQHWQPELMMRPGMPNDGSIVLIGHDEIICRVKDVLPDVKVIIGLRNQIEWFESMYVHHIGHLQKYSDDRSFFAFSETLEGKSAYYAAHYDGTLDSYASSFGWNNLFVFLLEELAMDEDKVLSDLCEFLEVPYHSIEQSVSSRNRTSLELKEKAKESNSSRVAKVSKKKHYLSRVFKRRNSNLVASNESISSGVLPNDVKRFIASAYAVSNHRTSLMIGKDLEKYGYPL
jgi:hypothetical protein